MPNLNESFIVSYVLAFGKLMQPVRFSINQRFFLFSAPALHLLFAVKGLLDTFVRFVVHQLDRQVLSGKLSTFAIPMLSQSQFQIPGTAGIIGSVGTLQYVQIAADHFTGSG